MKPKTMILMVVAVVCGLGASYMTSRLLAERDDTPAEAPKIEKVKLLVAKRNLEMHVAFRDKPEEFFIEKEFVKDDNLPKDALTLVDLPKLKGKFLKRALYKNNTIVADDLIGQQGVTTLPNGMRMIGIQVNQAAIAGGWASLPGSHVDIIWTSRAGGNDTFAKILLEDVIVLAADTRDSHDNSGAIVASVVSVAVTPDDVMKLTLAMDTGSLKLVLRNIHDVSTSDTDRITIADLQKHRSNTGKKVEDPAVAVVPPPIEAPKTEKDVQPPEPQRNLTKMTVTIRQGPDLQVHHYWVDEEDRVVAPPATGMPFDAVPLPGGGGKRDDSKKDEKKNVPNL